MTTNTASLRTVLSQVEDQIKALTNRRHELRQAIAKADARFSINDTVCCPSKPGELWLITDIRMGVGAFVEYHGRKYKSDGSAGAPVRQIFESFNFSLVRSEPPSMKGN